MGAPSDLSVPSSARLISTALSEKASGNPLSYFRLQHTLSSTNAAAITPLLTGLSHFATSTPSPDLRTLIDLALRVNLPSLISPPPSATHPSLDALLSFIENLISADPAYVHPVLQHFVTRTFLLPIPHRGPLLKYALRAVSAVLSAHPRAATLLVSVLAARFPHPVRPAPEHQAFLSAALLLARDPRWPALSRSILAAVMERAGTVEALVPPALRADDGALSPQADKMQAVLLQLVAHADAAAAEEGYVARVFEPLFDAYQAAIVPVETPRFSPYALLYAASRGGETLVWDAVERLRLTFFDEEVPPRLRDKFLRHSSALVMRARLVGARAARAWVAGVARWLNRYVDAQERCAEAVEADVDVHLLFYSACCAVMTTVCARMDAYEGGAGAEELNGMRLYRVMGCGLKPVVVVPRGIVREFARAVGEIPGGGLDVAGIVEREEGRYTPSRTRFGGRNEFEYRGACAELEMEEARERVEEFVRWGHSARAEGKETVGSPASARAGADAFAREDVEMAG